MNWTTSDACDASVGAAAPARHWKRQPFFRGVALINYSLVLRARLSRWRRHALRPTIRWLVRIVDPDLEEPVTATASFHEEEESVRVGTQRVAVGHERGALSSQVFKEGRPLVGYLAIVTTFFQCQLTSSTHRLVRLLVIPRRRSRRREKRRNKSTRVRDSH